MLRRNKYTVPGMPMKQPDMMIFPHYRWLWLRGTVTPEADSRFTVRNATAAGNPIPQVNP